MTAREIYHRGLVLLNETGAQGEGQYDTELFEKNAPTLINILIVMLDELDCFIKNKKVPENRYEPQRIETLDDTVFMHPAITEGVMPFGLAYLLILEEDGERAGVFYKRYHEEKEGLRKRFTGVKRHSIKSVY